MSLPKNVTGYRFIDKDPMIDVWREAKRRSAMSLTDIERAGGPKASTMNAWDKGQTKRPHNLTMNFAMAAMGFNQVWENREGHRLRCVYTKEAIKAENVVRFRKSS